MELSRLSVRFYIQCS